jgi:hypothetical protein
MDIRWSPGLRVKLDTLPILCRALVQALGRAQLSAADISEVVVHRVRASCVVCGIQANGSDLHVVALANPGQTPADPRLARLQQGYCCRRGCDSYYYDLQFSPHPACDWNVIIAQLAAMPLTPEADPAEADAGEGDRAPTQRDVNRRKFLLGAGAAALLLLALFGLRHVWAGGSLPGRKRPPKYSADPASTVLVPRE